MQAQDAIAEQTSRSRYWPPAPLPAREIELTIRLRVPEGEGPHVGISLQFAPPLPEGWDDSLFQYLRRGVHAGLARVGAPLPEGGIDVDITLLSLVPPLRTRLAADETERLGVTLEALTASTVAGLLAGLINQMKSSE